MIINRINYRKKSYNLKPSPQSSSSHRAGSLLRLDIGILGPPRSKPSVFIGLVLGTLATALEEIGDEEAHTAVGVDIGASHGDFVDGIEDIAKLEAGDSVEGLG